MSLADKLRALAVAARGAHELHEHGELHAAICPQAVALCEDGSAVLGPPSLTNGKRPLAQVGYPPLAYIDPQLLRGEGGRWSDIWALGATAYQIAMDVPPFQGLEEAPVVQALSQLLASPAPALHNMPAAISDLVGECLAVGPADRPQTAAEVATRLDDAASRC
jgi:serine/threonine-protein kinase